VSVGDGKWRVFDVLILSWKGEKRIFGFFVSSKNYNEMVAELNFKFTASPNKVIHNGM
jgi:hypothetical protein